MKTIFIILTSAILLAASCERINPPEAPNHTNTVVGYALTTDSLDPIRYITLDMVVKKGSYTTPQGGKQVTTDSTGRFEFTYTGPADGQVGIGSGGSQSR